MFHLFHLSSYFPRHQIQSWIWNATRLLGANKKHTKYRIHTDLFYQSEKASARDSRERTWLEFSTYRAISRPLSGRVNGLNQISSDLVECAHLRPLNTKILDFRCFVLTGYILVAFLLVTCGVLKWHIDEVLASGSFKIPSARALEFLFCIP